MSNGMGDDSTPKASCNCRKTDSFKNPDAPNLYSVITLSDEQTATTAPDNSDESSTNTISTFCDANVNDDSTVSSYSIDLD